MARYDGVMQLVCGSTAARASTASAAAALGLERLVAVDDGLDVGVSVGLGLRCCVTQTHRMRSFPGRGTANQRRVTLHPSATVSYGFVRSLAIPPVDPTALSFQRPFRPSRRSMWFRDEEKGRRMYVTHPPEDGACGVLRVPRGLGQAARRVHGITRTVVPGSAARFPCASPHGGPRLLSTPLALTRFPLLSFL